MQSLDDEIEAFVAVQAGEVQAFRRIVEAHQDSVFRVCLGIVNDAGLAEDLTQETFIRAFQKIELFDSTCGRPVAWLVTIARRLCLNSIQKIQPISVAEVRDKNAAPEGEPDAAASRTDVFQALDQALSELSDDHRRVFVLAEIEELPHAEIAKIEEIAIGTVKSRISRAKQILQGHLRPTFDEINEA